MEKVSSVRKAGFTIAPEAGSQRLRDIINKNLTEEQILNAAIYAKNAGYNGAKLYFMCGLPFETDEDILAIAELVRKIQYATKGGRFFNLTVSVSNFVPKPFTPFERSGQASAETLLRRHQLLKDAFRKNSAKLRFHNIYMSTLEAALSRGGTEWKAILLKALENGFYLDAWSECFSRDSWMELFDECGEDLNALAQRSFALDEKLPWSNISCGASDAWLIKEMEKASREETTADCRHGPCTNCGVCDFKTIKNVDAPMSFAAMPTPQTPSDVHMRFEIKYSKTGPGALLSALDTARIFSHMLLSQGVRMKFTGGFNPSPRLITQSPLPVGVSGTDESVLFEAEPASVTADTITKLNNFAPQGIEILSLEQAAWPKNMSRYEMEFTFDDKSFAFLNEAIKNNTASYEKTSKEGKVKIVNIFDYLLKSCGDCQTVMVATTEKGGFHFPEFFRKAGYGGIPIITRTLLKVVG
jgi:radical SAM-linked protein